MRAEHLLQWLIAVTQDDSPDDTNWLKIVVTVQSAFREGTLAKQYT